MGRLRRDFLLANNILGESFHFASPWAPPAARDRGRRLHPEFKTAGFIEVLPDFAIAMDAFLIGAQRSAGARAPAPMSGALPLSGLDG